MPKSTKQTRRRGVPDTYTTRATVKLSAPQYRAVQKKAEKDGTTVSTVIREAVERSFDDQISK